VSRQDDVQTSVERADPLVGTIFDKRFRVEERIAAGGFGAIYRATHVKSGHPIALKVLLRELARDLGVVARFRREGDALTALRNPHTITAYELGQAADKTLFIVMELLYGESLFEKYKANGPLEWKRVVKIAGEVCEALEEAHALGIVHRDLKPTNIHLEERNGDRDYVKVLDFGIAKILGAGAADLTNAGQMIGTIDYMSPEQMVGAAVTGQSDIYTLGIVMYEVIAGAPPFGESMTASQALAAVMKTKPQALYLRAPVPEELDRIVMRCLERDTQKRYATVAELRHDLERLLEGVAPTRAQLVTKPMPRAEDERTELTPVPRIGDWAQESTTLVPPPAQLVASSRRKRETEEPTQFTPPPEALLAQTRRPGRDSDFELTQMTPPPAKLLDKSRQWDDDDEQLPTEAVRRGRALPKRNEGTNQAANEHERVTAIASLEDIAQRAAQTRAQANDDRAATTAFTRSSEQVMTAAYPRRAESSPGTRKPSTLPPAPTPPRRPPSGAPASRTMTPQPQPAAPRTFTPEQPPLPRTFTPGQNPRAMSPASQPFSTPQTPIPQLVAAPYSTPAPAVEPYMPVVSPVAVGAIAPRDAFMRRVIWIAAGVVFAVVVLILAVL
jgi:serine/threonine protein kinase